MGQCLGLLQVLTHGLAVFLCYFRERGISANHAPILPTPLPLSPHTADSSGLKSLIQCFSSAAPRHLYFMPSRNF